MHLSASRTLRLYNVCVHACTDTDMHKAHIEISLKDEGQGKWNLTVSKNVLAWVHVHVHACARLRQTRQAILLKDEDNIRVYGTYLHTTHVFKTCEHMHIHMHTCMHVHLHPCTHPTRQNKCAHGQT